MNTNIRQEKDERPLGSTQSMKIKNSVQFISIMMAHFGAILFHFNSMLCPNGRYTLEYNAFIKFISINTILTAVSCIKKTGLVSV